LTGKDENDDGKEHEGQRKSAMRILAELNERGFGGELQEICLEHHLTPMEVCDMGTKVAPLPLVRAKLWVYMTRPEGPAWSSVRVAKTFGVDATSVSEAVRKLVGSRKKRRGK